MKATDAGRASPASQRISSQIAALGDWRGEVLARLRQVILRTAPEVTEEWKWSTAVWSHQGLVCAAGAFKDPVKLNFFKGASLRDPKRLFNSGLDAKATRAIDVHEGDHLHEPALQDLIRAAVALNTSGGGRRRGTPRQIPSTQKR